MLYNYFTENLIGLQGLIVKEVKKRNDLVDVYGELERKTHICPKCGNQTEKIHDYREQIIKDIPAFGKNIYLHLRKHRYHCQYGKKFLEKNTFLTKYQHCTKRLSYFIVDKLIDVTTYTAVTKEANVSVNKVMVIGTSNALEIVFYIFSSKLNKIGSRLILHDCLL